MSWLKKQRDGPILVFLACLLWWKAWRLYYPGTAFEAGLFGGAGLLCFAVAIWMYRR